MNECDVAVLPVAKSNCGCTPLQLPTTTGGFVLQPGQSITISVPPSWSGVIWGGTRCSIEDSGAFHCLTGDCGSAKVGCGGESDLLQPASTSIAAFTFNATDGMYYYEVSFKNGYNLPIIVVTGGRRNGGDDEHHCTNAGCAVNLISSCPPELRYSDESLGCKSACQAFAEPSFCCSTAAAFNCSTNRYTDFFRQACPKANSFANDKTSTFSCPFQQGLVGGERMNSVMVGGFNCGSSNLPSMDVVDMGRSRRCDGVER
ncbi:hypothetical protein FEM48_Zijuj05G0039700 [Ziziphus jujuba var. spinosa]|uniref:Thaumatin-like protein 1b n=1 Tax=Ziziphus jujuba var. spinosa TaxID=714518 RepID=A0A978VCP7_ZIZJJ|nr:hypothetical protein FEM48_Zijuj05G0039700 [Ziziphus jujuba var. spinosa]